jgi:Spy/CpxP family protein refolding chaperone
MKLEVHSKLAAALMAACLVPALAFSQSVVPDAPDNQAGPAGPPTTVTVHGPEGPGMDMRMDVDVRRGPGMGMDMGSGMGRGMGMGMGMHRGGGHEMGLEWAINNPKLREQLLITPEQVAKIRQESLNFRKAEILSRADLEVKRLELDSLLEAETPDRAAIEKSLRAANAAQFTVEKAAIDHQLAVRDLVTPEQRKKLEKMREEFRRPGAGPGGPGGPRGMTHPGGNVFYMRQDGGGMMHPGANGMMRPNVLEKRIIVRSDEATAVPAPPPPPPAPPQQ